MKKEGMKKLFFAGKPGLKTGSGNFNILLLFFLLNENLFPQIPINGFCKYNSYSVDSGYTNLIMINYNNDAYSDLLLYNPLKKEVASVQGALKGEFKEIKKFTLPLEISSIHPLNYKSSTRFVFTNRKKRKAGFYDLDINGKPVLTRETDFNYYPDHISTADINADGKNEILISGGAFYGISILYRNEKRLIEKDIIEGTYSRAVFIELNNDGFPDIAGYDLASNSFNFFYNNSLGEFRKARSIPFSEKPAGLKTFDVNLDSYEDLIFSSQNSINIWYGDYRSSYDVRKKIATKYKPDKFIYGDFNNDGLIDFAYLNVKQSLVSLLFAKNDTDFYPDIVYLWQEGLKDIIPYYSRFIDGIAALSVEGSLYTITNVSSFTDDVNISVGAKPCALTFFDNQNNGITDFCFIDQFDNKIKFIVRNNTGIPALYFSQQLYENHEKIVAENLKAGEKNYICFSYNKRLIEVVKADFNSNKISKTVLYSPGAILDLKIRREDTDDYKIFIIYKLNESLNIGFFDFNNFSFNFSSRVIADNIDLLDASVGLSSIVNVNFWITEKDNVLLYNYQPGKISEFREEKFSLRREQVNSITSFTGDLLNMEKNISISFINGKTEMFAVVSADTLVSFVKETEDEGYFRITSRNQLFFGETRFSGLKKLCIYLPEKNLIARLEFIRQGKNIVFTELTEISEPGGFFIKNMTSKNYHIVYSDLVKNCITIKRLKG
jgi:hypothetical protein